MKRIIKILALITSLVLLVVLCSLVLKYDKVNKEEMNTPVHISPSSPKVVPKPVMPTVKPLMRDENDMPKSDYKVPEIG